MLYVISYDVADDVRRHRVSEALLDFGRRVQYSVFECELDEKGLAELRARVELAIDPLEDSCRWYRLCAGCRAEVRVMGKGEPFQDVGYLIV
jgi:CRISPR-associated protein Cas2